MHNYTLYDFLVALEALLVFPAFLFAPGYVTGWATNLFGFREKSGPERILFGALLSTGVTPIAATLLCRLISLSALNAGFIGATAVFIGIVIYEARNRSTHPIFSFKGETRILAFAMAAWALLALALLIDIQIGERLYLSTSVFDHSIRVAFARSILKNGVPPVNPLFFPGHVIPLHYYYYWFLVCALPAKLLGIDPRLTVYASCAWAGFALAATVPLYLKYFMADREQLRRKSVWGIALLLVTGLDLLPILVYLFSPGHTFFPEMEWWDSEPVGSWLSSILWAPHHIVALVACLSGFLVIWRCGPGNSGHERATAWIIAGAAFASAAGLSVYVALTFGLFLVVWGFWLLAQRSWRELLILSAAGATALALSFPYLRELRAGGAGAQFISWGLRWHTGDSLQLLHINSPLMRKGASLLEMPLMYLLELGFFFAVGALRLRRLFAERKRLEAWEIASWLMLGTSLAVASFLRSDVITANDLGIRSVLLMQFVLLLWAVPLVYEWRTTRGANLKQPRAIVRPWTLGFLLILGLVATVYQLSVMRSYAFFHDNTAGSPDYRVPSKDLAAMVYSIRSDFDSLDKALPASAVVQADPWSHFSLPYPLYATRRAISSIPQCGYPFSGSMYEHQCYQLQLIIGKAFNYPDWLATKYVDAFCNQFSIDALLVTSRNPVWQARDSWVWQRPALFADQEVRIIGCGRGVQPQSAGVSKPAMEGN